MSSCGHLQDINNSKRKLKWETVGGLTTNDTDLARHVTDKHENVPRSTDGQILITEHKN